MLELVVGQRLDLAMVALGDRLEKRFARVVTGKPLIDDRPGERFAVLVRCELVAHRGGVGPKAAKRSSLLAPVGMAKGQPVARRACPDSSSVHSLHQPVPAAEQHHRTRRERVLTRVRARVLAAGAAVRHERVRKRHVQGGS